MKLNKNVLTRDSYSKKILNLFTIPLYFAFKQAKAVSQLTGAIRSKAEPGPFQYIRVGNSDALYREQSDLRLHYELITNQQGRKQESCELQRNPWTGERRHQYGDRGLFPGRAGRQ